MSKHRPAKVRGITEVSSAIWEIRFTDAEGKRRRERAGTRQGAIDLLNKRRAEARDGVKLPPKLRTARVTVGDLIETARAYGLVHHASQKGDNDRSKLLLELFGPMAADALTPGKIEEKLGDAATEREWAPATFNRYRAQLSLAYRLAVANGKVESNPARLVRQRRENNSRVRWLTVEEEARLVAVIEANYPDQLPAFLLSLHTGMRRSEQYRRIQWQDVDFEQRRLWVPGSKNGNPRSIPLNGAAIRSLLTLRERGDRTGPVMRARVGGHGLLAGEAQKTPRQWFENACRNAGLIDYTWHCNRHTFASRLIMAGVSLRTVQELMGHKTIAMTCRYAHLAPQHQLDAVCKLDGWGQAGNQQPDARPGDTEAGMPNGLKIGQPPIAGHVSVRPAKTQAIAVQ